MKGLGVISGQYLPTLWTKGHGVQDLAFRWHPYFREQTVLQFIFCSFEPNIQLREVTLWYLESRCTLPKHPGRLPLTDVVFSSYEGGAPNLPVKDRKHSRVSTILLYMVKYRYPMVISIIYVSSHHTSWPQNMQLCRFSHEFVPFQALLEGVLSTLQLHWSWGRPSIANKCSGCLVYIMIMTAPAFDWMNISPSCPFRGSIKVKGLSVCIFRSLGVRILIEFRTPYIKTVLKTY